VFAAEPGIQRFNIGLYRGIPKFNVIAVSQQGTGQIAQTHVNMLAAVPNFGLRAG
jgi:hypothetical protein